MNNYSSNMLGQNNTLNRFVNNTGLNKSDMYSNDSSSTGARVTPRTVNSLADELYNRKQQIKTAADNEAQNNRINTSISLFGHGVSVDDTELKSKYDQASNESGAASLIVEWGNENGIEYTGTNRDIINSYIRDRGVEDYRLATKNFLHGNISQGEWIRSAGLNKPYNLSYEDERTIEELDDIQKSWVDYGLSVLGNFIYPLKLIGGGTNEVAHMLTKGIFGETDPITNEDEDIQYATSRAIADNSALGIALTEYEKSMVERAISDQEIMDKYINDANYLNGIIKIAEGVGISAMMLRGKGYKPWAMMGGLSVGLELPIIREILTAFPSVINRGTDLVLNEALNNTWVGDVRDLLDEETKGTLAAIVAGQTLNKVTPWVGKKISSSNLYNSLKEDAPKYFESALKLFNLSKKKDGTTDIKPATSKLPTSTETDGNLRGLRLRSNENIRKLDYETNKLFPKLSIAENQDVSNAILNLPREVVESLKKGGDYTSLFKENDKYTQGKISIEDAIADTIDKTFGPEEDIWAGDDWALDGTPGQAEPNNPIGESISLLERMNPKEKASPDMRKKINAVRNRYEQGLLTIKNLLYLKRALSKEYVQYKYGETGPELVTDREFQNAYNGLNYLIRREFDAIPEFQDAGISNIMETLDSQLSPNLNLRTRIISIMNDVNESLGNIPSDINKRKLGNDVSKINGLGGVFRVILNRFIKEPESISNAAERAENLHAALVRINKVLKDIPEEDRSIMNNAITDYIKRKFAGPKETYGGNLGEGEVIEPESFFDDFVDWTSEYNTNRYLEDIVEVVPKESNMLGEDAKYNGNPVDYTTPTRITPEGYAAEYGETLESWEGKQPGGYGAPAEEQAMVEQTFKNEMDKAGVSKAQQEKLINLLRQSNYKVKQQPSLFQDYPTQEEAKEITKQNKGQEKPKLDLKSIQEELDELEKLTSSRASSKATPKKAGTKKTATKKVSQEDIDHLFGKDKPELKKGKKSDK